MWQGMPREPGSGDADACCGIGKHRREIRLKRGARLDLAEGDRENQKRGQEIRLKRGARLDLAEGDRENQKRVREIRLKRGARLDLAEGNRENQERGQIITENSRKIEEKVKSLGMEAGMINFNVPPYVETAADYIQECVQNQKICGDGAYTKRCNEWLEKRTGAVKCLLTTSCTHATEMAALLTQVGPGDEVIMPSYTFVSTADAFVLRGATPVFVDIRPDTMNIDETKIEAAITERTKGIVPVHYAGVACEMDTIMDIAYRHKLWVIEDAAQGIQASYKGKALGTFGNFGCFSFHETKNYSMGEGGALLIRDEECIEDAEVIREKGTNRSKFYRGQIDKYTWVNFGSSYLPSDMNAAYLYAQLEIADQINDARLALWKHYQERLSPLAERGKIELPVIPEECVHNAHMFYIKAAEIEERSALIAYLKGKEILAVFHYIPLHTAPAGLKYGRFHGEDVYTTQESERLVRLPMYYGLKMEQVDYICEQVEAFYG